MAVKQAFTADTAAFARKASANFEQVFRITGLEILKRIVQRTPVDTGRARAGWGISEGKEQTVILDNSVLQTGSAVSVLDAAVARPPEMVISNNVPYILALEYGHSKQAPAGMVRPTIAEFANIVSVATQEKAK